MRTKEIDVRIALRNNLELEFRDDSSSIIIDEMQVCFGEARVDVAVVNGSLHGYEIKSDSDTLDRLPQQVEYYNQVFDYMTLVCSDRFVDKIHDIVPAWWGVKLASANNDGLVDIEYLRLPKENNNINPHSLVQLLWRDEALTVLHNHGFDKGVRSKTKWDIWHRMVERMELAELRSCVRTCLKSRSKWRADLLQK